MDEKSPYELFGKREGEIGVKDRTEKHGPLLQKPRNRTFNLLG